MTPGGFSLNDNIWHFILYHRYAFSLYLSQQGFSHTQDKYSRTPVLCRICTGWICFNGKPAFISQSWQTVLCFCNHFFKHTFHLCIMFFVWDYFTAKSYLQYNLSIFCYFFWSYLYAHHQTYISWYIKTWNTISCCCFRFWFKNNIIFVYTYFYNVFKGWRKIWFWVSYIQSRHTCYIVDTAYCDASSKFL